MLHSLCAIIVRVAAGFQIDDIVEGVIRVMQKAPERALGEDGLPIPPYAVYNIGNNQPENLLDFVDILQQPARSLSVKPKYAISGRPAGP